MQFNILSDQQKKMVDLVKQFSNDFYLVGGTALALQLGHRRSIDFDLFSRVAFDSNKIKSIVQQNWEINQVYVNSKNELTMMVENVKMTWYKYDFNIPLGVSWSEVIKMPDILHIAAMKAYALGHRAKWKDYVDLYFVFQKYGFNEVTTLTTKIFGRGLFDERLLREQLVYYDDVSFKEEVEFISGFEVSTDEIKKFLADVAVS